MILPVHAAVRTALTDTLSTRFSIAPDDQPAIVIDVPPKRALGDLAVPIAFELARRLRQAPRAIAKQIADAVGPIAGVARVDATPNGYLNFFLDRTALTEQWLRSDRNARESDGKVIVEHTAINPNKAAHIGHLRNATLGDTLVRLLRFQGRAVEVQNYIDDTGVQVADVVVGFTTLEGRDLAGVQSLIADPAIRFDYYCWDLYARVTEWYTADKTRLDDPERGAPCDRGRRQRVGRDRRGRRRPDRPHASGHDGAAERRLRPPHLGRRHPSAALLDDGLRAVEGDWRGIPA